MYQVRDSDLVVPLDGLPQPDVGAPMPLVLADDHAVVISYLVAANVVDYSSTAMTFGFLRFRLPRFHSLGLPSDETLRSHPLWSRGLRAYGVYRVDHSSLTQRLKDMNSAHPAHDPNRFDALTHYMLTFHDSTFECVARSVESRIELCGESWTERISRMQAVRLAD